jgi:DNA-binding HxlR family transcriptional regulator
VRYSKRLCVYYQRALEVISKRWSGLIIVALLNGPLRFSELAEQLEVVSDRMLSERLKELESEAIVERRVYVETPVRVEYRLTEKGHALEPIIAAIGQWGHEWLEAAPAEAHGPEPVHMS